METGRCCKWRLWTWCAHWNHTNYKFKKSPSIPSDDVPKSTRMLHKCHISCQANEKCERLASTHTCTSTHICIFIRANIRQHSGDCKTFPNLFTVSWILMLSAFFFFFFKCHVLSLVSLFLMSCLMLWIYTSGVFGNGNIFWIQIFFSCFWLSLKINKGFYPHINPVWILSSYDPSVTVLTLRSLFCTHGPSTLSLFAMLPQKPALSL